MVSLVAERLFCYISHMPRNRSFTTDELRDRALHKFWRSGYEATSMDELVDATGVSRHGIYKEFGSKRALYLACFEHYQDTVVSPAFSPVEGPHGTLEEIRRYFEFQIAAAERLGLPGPGCFVGNSTTEVAPHDSEARKYVEWHNHRLKAGFANALQNSVAAECQISRANIAVLAESLLIFATGLWAQSRISEDADALRASVKEFLDQIEKRLS